MKQGKTFRKKDYITRKKKKKNQQGMCIYFYLLESSKSNQSVISEKSYLRTNSSQKS